MNDEQNSIDNSGLVLPGDSRFDRRNALKYGGMALGAAAVAPTLLTLGASPASASGRPSDQNAGNYNSGNVSSLTTSQLNEPVGVLIATVALQSNDQTITAPEGWTALTKVGTTGQTTSSRLCVQQFYIIYPTVQTAKTYQFSWSTAAPSAVSVTMYPTARTVVTYSDPVLSTTGTSRTSAGATVSIPSGSSGPACIIMTLGYSRSASAPTPGAPSDSVNGTYTEVGTARTTTVGSQQWAVFPAKTGDSGTVTIGSMTNGRPSVTRVIVVT